MALDNNTQLVYTDKITIKNWFKTGLKPKQDQFWAQFDSYWHKSESLPISSIKGLGDLLDGKAEENHTHSEYATNDAASLTAQNITQWQNKLGINDLDYVVIPTEDATVESHPYVVVIDNEGNSARRNATDFGKVDTIDGIEADEYKDVKLGAVRKSESNTVTDDFSMQQENGAYVSIGLNGLKVGFGGITATYGTSSISVDNKVPDAAYKFQEILFPKRAVKNVEEKVYPVTYIQGVKADETGRVDISGVAMNWTNSSHRYSGILDKSADATFNQFALFDSNGNLAKASQIANAFEAGLKNTTAEQGLRIGQLLNGGQGSVGMMSVTSISPPVVEKIDSMEYLLIRGTNLYLNVTSMSIEIVKSSDNTTVVKIPNSQIQLYDNGLSLVVGYNFKDLPFGEYKLKITSGVKVLITTLTLRVVENVEHINIDAITWDVVTNSSYDFTNKYTVAGRSLWVKSPFTGVDSNVPIFSAKSSTLFNAGENFVIEFTMNYAAQNNFGSTVHTRFGLTSSDLTNILNYISLAYFNFWCMGGHTISYNIQGVVGDSKSSATSGTLDCKIVKNGNLFTLMIESIIYAVTISNNNNYSFIFQMPDRKFASGGEEDTLLITKAYKYN